MKTDSTRSIKIITPTHFAVFGESTTGDSALNHSLGGTYKINGDKYVEEIIIASWDGYGQEKTDFTIKVDGDTYYQKGTLTLSDGTVHQLDEVWHKVKTNNSYTGKGIGTWEQLSSSYGNYGGERETHTNATATRFQIITPTHWMRISHRDGKFENSMGGMYTMEGDTIHIKMEFATFPIDESIRYLAVESFKGDKMYVSGVAIHKEKGKVFEFDDVFQKVDKKKLTRSTAKK